jgi:hypothetical protein
MSLVMMVRQVSQFYKHYPRLLSVIIFLEKEVEKRPNLANWLTLGTKLVRQVSPWITLGMIFTQKVRQLRE